MKDMMPHRYPGKRAGLEVTDANPDLDWYLSISQRRGVTPRCPFASADRCPRYFESLSLLGSAGSTRIPDADEKRLKKKWERSDLWPLTGEQCASISGGNGRYTCFSNFCPEVSFERFSLFATGLYEHSDELDREFAHRQLEEQAVPYDSWRWRYWSIKPLHFTECSLYSPLSHAVKDLKNEEALTLKPTLWGMSVDLKVLWHRCIGALLGRNKAG